MKTYRELTQLSKTMSYHLRHHPEELGIVLDKEGWTDLPTFAEKLQARCVSIDSEVIERIVKSDKKGRYSIRCAYDEHGEFVVGSWQIRANQGHSAAQVDLEFTPKVPEGNLYHGTSEERWELIQKSGGLKPMTRQYVHLSGDLETAKNVANRWRPEEPIILVIAKESIDAMVKQGTEFYISENGVWLTKSVPLEHLYVGF